MVSLEELLGSGSLDENLRDQIKDLDQKKDELILMKRNNQIIYMNDAIAIENSYDRLSKSSSIGDPLKIYLWENNLELMNEFQNLRSWKYLGKRATTNYNLGITKRDPIEKKKHFSLAFGDLEQEIEKLRKDTFEEIPLNYALRKAIDVCSSLSGYLSDSIDERDLKLKVIDRGLNSIKELRASNGLKENFKTRYVNSFFYLRKAELVPHEKSRIHGEGIILLKEAFQSASFDDLDKNSYSYAAKAFSDSFDLKSKRNKDLDCLEDLIFGIVCQELSEKLGNHKEVNYQAIGREYYDLSYFIKTVNLVQTNEISERVKKVINFSNSSGEKVFGDYDGGLLNILDKTNPNEMQFIVLENALGAFEKSAFEGDEDPGNKSYKGKCITEIARLNNFLRKYSEEEIREKLEYAEKNLNEVLDKRIKEKPDDLYKDYTRLSDCQFRLAGLISDLDKKIDLYQSVIKNNKGARDLLESQRKFVGNEIYSYIASAHYKLAEFCQNKNIKKVHLEETKKYLNKAKKAGDDSPQNRSKNGSCLLDLLKMELKGLTKIKIKHRIIEIKQTLGEAALINQENQESFVYPLILSYYLSKNIEEGDIPGMTTEEFGLKKSKEYIQDAIQLYFSNPRWVVRQLSESANFVCETRDNYGLLGDTFILKKGEEKKLQHERTITDDLIKMLNDQFGVDRYYITPRPHGIFYHQDADPNLTGEYYVMSYKAGATLDRVLRSERINSDKKFEVLENIVDYLAFMHAKIKIDDTDFRFDRGRKDISDRLLRLQQSGFPLTSNELEDVLSNYSVIEESFKNSLLVFNKDAHPGNWMLRTNGNIIALDFEGGVIPQAYDLVKLMESSHSLPLDKKDELIRGYLDSYRKYRPDQILDFNNLKFQYLNSTLHKAFTFIGGFSKQKSDVWNRNVIVAIENAQRSVDYIRNNLSSDERYKNLGNSLDHLYELVVAETSKI